MLSKIILKIVKLFIKGHGFNADKERIKINEEGNHWFLGANNVPKEILRPDGQWDGFLPEDELQNMNGVESWSCTVFGTLNALEILVNEKYGQKSNWAERYLAVLSNIRYGAGGSPHEVAEQIRNKGNVAQPLLPFDKTITTWSKFMSPKPMTKDLLDEGHIWLDKYDFNHEWLNDLTQNGIMEALRYSPLGAGVYAWAFDGIYYYKAGTDNHWICIYGYVKGQYWKVFDSYDNTHKKVAWNYPWQFAKRYYIVAKDENEVSAGRSLHERLVGQYILRSEANGELYKVEKDRLIYCVIYINENSLKDEFNKFLRVKDNFVGISEKDFAVLSTAVIMGGGTVDKPININDLIK